MVGSAQLAKVLHDFKHDVDDSATATMFLSALPHMFGGERHEFQLRLSNMLRDTLKQARDKRTEKRSSAMTSLEETKATMEKLQQEKSAAEAFVEKSQATVEEKAATLSEKQKEAKMASQIHTHTTRDNKSVETEHLELKESKGRIDSIVDGSLNFLVNGSWDSEETRDDFMKPVMDYLEDMGCNKVLLASLPKAFGCCPEKRGEFAKVAVREAVEQLKAKAASVGKSLEESKVRFEEAKAETLGAWAIADVALDDEKVAAAAKIEAETNLHNATVECKLALSKVTDIQEQVEGMQAEQASIEAKIAEIESALIEMDQLENEMAETNKENIDIASPAAKRMKLSEGEPSPAMQGEIAPAISVQ